MALIDNKAKIQELIACINALPEAGDAEGITTYLASVLNGEVEEIVNDKIIKIPEGFQSQSKNLKKADLPLITKLPGSCFSNCSNLASVNFPAVTEIKGGAMDGCGVTELVFPECVSITGWGWTFSNNRKLEKAVFPKLTNITVSSFSNCDSLTALILGSSSVVTLGDVSAFANSGIANRTGYVYVPRDLVESYKTAPNWSTYADQIRALEDYTVDGTTTGELDPTKI